MNSKLHTVLICSSIFLFFVSLYFFQVFYARADSPEETALRNEYFALGLSLFTLSVGLGVRAVFLEVPHDPAKKFQGKRLGCLAGALLIIGTVVAMVLKRVLLTDH